METRLQNVDIRRWVILSPTTASRTNCHKQAVMLVDVITPRAKKSKTERNTTGCHRTVNYCLGILPSSASC